MSKPPKPKSELYYPHKKNYLFEISETISFCGNCSSALILDKLGNVKSTIKPLKYETKWEDVSFSFFQESNSNKSYKYCNYKGFMEIRSAFIKKIKAKCENLELKSRTYFLAIDYFCQICSIFTSFSTENLLCIVDICIILAAKTNETKKKALQVKHSLSENISPNTYLLDELYILSQLNYDLIRITSYDILLDIMKCGFVFDDEEVNINVLDSVYNQLENMLYLFSETKHYICMTPKEIAIGLMGLAREILGLTAFSKNIQIVFMNIKELDDMHNSNYIKCLNKIRKCFKIVKNNNSNNKNNNKNNNHSDSTKDSNSDN